MNHKDDVIENNVNENKWYLMEITLYDKDGNEIKGDHALRDMTFDGNSLVICNIEDKCSDVKYQDMNEKIIIDSNELFTGTFGITVVEDTMTLIKELGDNEKVVYYFERNL